MSSLWLGGSTPSDSTLIIAQDFYLSFPLKIRYVNAVLSGSNGQVDFNNIGFTGEVSAVPTPAAEWLLGTDLLELIGFARRYPEPITGQITS
jgi:hypothetical protein